MTRLASLTVHFRLAFALSAALASLVAIGGPVAAGPVASSGTSALAGRITSAAPARTAVADKSAKDAVVPASDDAIGFSAASAGTSFEVSYAGYVAGAPAEGLSGAGRFEFHDATDAGRTWNFRIHSLANTSIAPISAARISQFGFNVSPDLASATAVGLFDTIDYAGNVPMAGLRDLCFRASAGGSCAGGGSAGLLLGESISDGFFSLMFDSALDAISLSNFFLRFQSIEGAAGTSGVGIGGAPSLLISEVATRASVEALDAGAGDATEVPEPEMLGLLTLGAGTIGWRMRRRSRAKLTA